MSSIMITQVISGSAMSQQSVTTRQADGNLALDPTLPAAQAGSITTWIADDDGVATMTDAGHDLATSETVDLFWNDGLNGRYGMTVGAVVGQAVPVTGGTGDPLPVQGTAVTVARPVAITAPLDGDTLVLWSLTASQPSRIDVQNDASASIVARTIAADEPWLWISGTGADNPLAGQTVARIVASNANTVDAVLKVLALHDVTV